MRVLPPGLRRLRERPQPNRVCGRQYSQIPLLLLSPSSQVQSTDLTHMRWPGHIISDKTQIFKMQLHLNPNELVIVNRSILALTIQRLGGDDLTRNPDDQRSPVVKRLLLLQNSGVSSPEGQSTVYIDKTTFNEPRFYYRINFQHVDELC